MIVTDVNMFVNTNTKGTILSGVDVIKQSFYNILTTPTSTRYRVPTYGSYLPFMLQQQLTPDTAYQCKGYAIQALTRWEPRATIIEEQVIFTKVNEYTIRGVIPAYIPDLNLLTEFSANFTK
jgi:phage baseplate assembly protein W